MNNLAADKNRRVLIIDDNRAIHDDFRKILSPATAAAAALDASEAALFGSPAAAILQTQFEVDSAYQGEEGARLVKKALAAGQPYALAFVDVRMPPGWDGVETTRKMWELDPDLQVVLCTAYADYSWGEMFDQLGQRDGLLILKKPFDAVEAFQLAHALTEKWWLARQSRRKMAELESMVAERTQELAKSLSMLNATFESMADGIVAVDLAGKIVSYNTKFADNWQFPAGMLARRDAAETRAHTAGQVKDPALFLQRIEELQADPEAEAFDVIELKDGRMFERYAFPQRIERQCVGTVINWRDITERKRAEAALRESLVRFELANRATFNAIWDWNLQTDALWWNENFQTLFGYRAGEIEPGIESWTNRIHPEDLDRIKTSIHAAIDLGRDHWFDTYRFRRNDGTYAEVEDRGYIARDANGHPARMIGAMQDTTERKRMEAALAASEQRFRAMTEQSAEGNALINADGMMLYHTPASTRLLGQPPEALTGRSMWEYLHPDELEFIRQQMAQILAAPGNSVTIALRWRLPDGAWRWLETAATNLLAESALQAIVINYRDITERKRLEAQLFQSQKMETVGKLAGGVAHEFNSILTAIIGQSDLLLGDLPPGHPLARNAAGIRKAAERAATLTRQLLAYGRKTFLRPESLDLNEVMASMAGTIRHLVGGEVDVRLVPAEGLHAVQADVGQIEQVIMNLAMNAADAMPNGGHLTLETANVSFDPESVGRSPELKPGDYVMLAMTDTGTGMSEAVKARAFEPFFSTKGVGQETGLGLSTGYGIIKQSGGHISVYSEPGRGASFKIYLPRGEPQPKIPLRRLDLPDLPRGSETILLVEDDPALREMATTLLGRLGYTVLAATDGVDALRLMRQHTSGYVDLLFTDVVMPRMSGKELVEQVRALYPQTRILFTSAYTEHAMIHQGVLNQDAALLQKPFTPSALAHKLREVLDAPDAPTPAPT